MILRLGHAELFVTDLQKSREFYVDVLGFIEAGFESGRLYLRGLDEFDKYTLILTENTYAALGHFGLRVSSPEYLEELKRKHDELGIKSEFFKESANPGQGSSLRVMTPTGHPVEFYHHMDQLNLYNEGGHVTALPMRTLHQRGIPPLSIDHVNLRVTNVDQAIHYWSALDFSISEYVEQPDGSKFAAWMRRKPTTHDIALVKSDRDSCHHLAYRVEGIAGVVKTADLLADAGYRSSIEYGPGRHGVTNAFFLYIRDPDGHRMELYTGDYNRDLDQPPIRWSKESYDNHGRLWWGSTVPESFFESSSLNKSWVK
ncbi:3,4-dihydroxyphenylacetate 2,3-dioxygenase [Paenibacillus frigoriresistens]|uniref:3,4-dihydroxyphenylacetate 2,3-dioxygenase n=1 Tax=Paenibacillus alginolyticus TaxID=59839 RepID=UPI0015651322|nr:3,4-dihydroxyphenylacetate 2,3-dioxygenase [Paenibacillus frigoriresistens]NRF94386.1 3,4-dihydroxyphenylacetate 2,3-dioxygenase [Paenibacillus frigoriresistens]